MLSDEKDARAFRPDAGAIEAMIEAEIAVAPQHYRRPRKGTPACGATNGAFFAATEYGVTCGDCRAYLTRRDAR